MSAPHTHAHPIAHGHDHEGSTLGEMDVRVRALETLLTQKGYVDPAALDRIIETYETKIGPHNGARVVARAWTDPDFHAWLLKDATAAIASFGFTGRQGEHMVAVENTPAVHNMVVCTLCSCYPWPVLGLPPVWYKSAPYRAKAVMDPRGVLADFGVTLPEDTAIRVWDSTAEVRYLVLPMRPQGTSEMSEDQLASLVTRDSMIGTGLALPPGAAPASAGAKRMNSVHDMGGMQGFGPVQPEADEPLFHAQWEARALAMTVAMGACGQWNIDLSRSARESLPPAVYLNSSYYEIWLRGLERCCSSAGLVSADELRSGHSLQPPAARGPRAARRCRGCGTGRRLPGDPPVRQPCAFCHRRPRACPQYAPGRPHAPAALRARPHRHGAKRPWHPYLSGPACVTSGATVRPDAGMALHRGIRRRRALGPGRRPNAAGQRGRVGTVP